jgi:hypothetical protein
MASKTLEKIAANVERFMNLVGIPDDKKRVRIEEELVGRMAGSGDKKPSLVYAQDHLYLYSDKTLVKDYPGLGAGSTRVLHCDSKKISILDRNAFLNNKTILITGTVAATALTGAALSEAEQRKRQADSGGPSSSNNNNNNNNNNDNNG